MKITFTKTKKELEDDPNRLENELYDKQQVEYAKEEDRY